MLMLEHRRRIAFDYNREGGRERYAEFCLVDAKRYYKGRRGSEALVRFLQCGGSSSEIDRLADRLQSCDRRKRCRLGCCRICGPVQRERETWKSLKLMVARYGQIPPRDRVTYVTILATQEERYLRAPLRPIRRFKSLLRDVRRRHLSSTAWVGYFEIGADGMLHLHAAAMHLSMARRDFVRILRKHLEGRATVRESVWRPGTDLDNYRCSLYYWTKFVPRIVKSRQASALDLARDVGGAVLGRLGAGSGFVGVRFSMNMSSQWRWLDDHLVNRRRRESRRIPEMAELARERRSGGNRKPLLHGVPLSG